MTLQEWVLSTTVGAYALVVLVYIVTDTRGKHRR